MEEKERKDKKKSSDKKSNKDKYCEILLAGLKSLEESSVSIQDTDTRATIIVNKLILLGMVRRVSGTTGQVKQISKAEQQKDLDKTFGGPLCIPASTYSQALPPAKVSVMEVYNKTINLLLALCKGGDQAVKRLSFSILVDIDTVKNNTSAYPDVVFKEVDRQLVNIQLLNVDLAESNEEKLKNIFDNRDLFATLVDELYNMESKLNPALEAALINKDFFIFSQGRNQNQISDKQHFNLLQTVMENLKKVMEGEKNESSKTMRNSSSFG